VVVVIVVAGAAGLILLSTQNESSTTASGSSSSTLTSSASQTQPCSNNFSNPPSNTTTLSNGTQITHSAFPVFAAVPGTTMMVCAQYSSGNYTGQVYDSVYAWGSNGQYEQTHSASITASPSSITLDTHLHSSTTALVEYSVGLSHNSTGFYGISLFQFCSPFPLAVGYEPSQVNSSDFSGLFSVRYCPLQSMSGQIVGYSGASIDYINSVTRSTPELNITDVSVDSFPTSSGGDNITFKMALRTFNTPLTVGLSLNQSMVRVFGGNPELTLLSTNYCSWYPNNDTAVSNYMTTTSFQSMPTGYMRLNAPMLNLGTYTNTTYAFSILVQGPIANYTAIDPTLFTNVQGHGQGAYSIGAYFPVKIGGEVQTVSGLCYPGT